MTPVAVHFTLFALSVALAFGLSFLLVFSLSEGTAGGAQ